MVATTTRSTATTAVLHRLPQYAGNPRFDSEAAVEAWFEVRHRTANCALQAAVIAEHLVSFGRSLAIGSSAGISGRTDGEKLCVCTLCDRRQGLNAPLKSMGSGDAGRTLLRFFSLPLSRHLCGVCYHRTTYVQTVWENHRLVQIEGPPPGGKLSAHGDRRRLWRWLNRR